MAVCKSDYRGCLHKMTADVDLVDNVDFGSRCPAFYKIPHVVALLRAFGAATSKWSFVRGKGLNKVFHFPRGSKAIMYQIYNYKS